MKLPRWWYQARRRWRRHGPRVHRRRFCAICQKRVWFSTRTNRSRRASKSGRRPSVFCSPECKAIKASPAKIPKDAPPPPPPKCPRPDKRGFGTEVECRAHFSTLLVTDPTLGVYLCRCRRWHAGHFAVDSALQIRNRARIRRLDTTADGAPLSEA